MKKLRPSYKPLKVLMINKDVSASTLRSETGIAPSTYTKINKDEWVALDVIAKICAFLDCRIENVVEFVEEK